MCDAKPCGSAPRCKIATLLMRGDDAWYIREGEKTQPRFVESTSISIGATSRPCIFAGRRLAAHVARPEAECLWASGPEGSSIGIKKPRPKFSTPASNTQFLFEYPLKGR